MALFLLALRRVAESHLCEEDQRQRLIRSESSWADDARAQSSSRPMAAGPASRPLRTRTDVKSTVIGAHASHGCHETRASTSRSFPRARPQPHQACKFCTAAPSRGTDHAGTDASAAACDRRSSILTRNLGQTMATSDIAPKSEVQQGEARRHERHDATGEVAHATTGDSDGGRRSSTSLGRPIACCARIPEPGTYP
jgi:hypothetical protein